MKFYDCARTASSMSCPTRRYDHASETFLTAQEIIVDVRERIRRAAHRRRTADAYPSARLGLLRIIGALLMAMRVARTIQRRRPRRTPAALTAHHDGRSVSPSRRGLRAITGGPFAGYDKNREPFLRVMRQTSRRRCATSMPGTSLVADNVLDDRRPRCVGRCRWSLVSSSATEIAQAFPCSRRLAPFRVHDGLPTRRASSRISRSSSTRSSWAAGLMKIVNQTVPDGASSKLGYLTLARSTRSSATSMQERNHRRRSGAGRTSHLSGVRLRVQGDAKGHAHPSITWATSR